MKQYIGARGTQIKVPTLEVNVDTVYFRTNITRLENEEFKGWQYDEIQYSLREYQELIGNKSSINEEYLVELDYRMSMMEMGLI